MKAKQFLTLWLVMTGLLTVTYWIQTFVTPLGVPEIALGSIAIPFVTAFIFLVLYIFVAKKYFNVDL